MVTEKVPVEIPAEILALAERYFSGEDEHAPEKLRCVGGSGLILQVEQEKRGEVV